MKLVKLNSATSNSFISNCLYLIILIMVQFIFGQNFQNIGLDNQDKLIRLPEAFIIETQIDPET